jgi:hypothetical protein
VVPSRPPGRWAMSLPPATGGSSSRSKQQCVLLLL